jgi:hypothetical protein
LNLENDHRWSKVHRRLFAEKNIGPRFLAALTFDAPLENARWEDLPGKEHTHGDEVQGAQPEVSQATGHDPDADHEDD